MSSFTQGINDGRHNAFEYAPPCPPHFQRKWGGWLTALFPSDGRGAFSYHDPDLFIYQPTQFIDQWVNRQSSSNTLFTDNTILSRASRHQSAPRLADSAPAM
ncbi:MAG: hypothetical protein U1B80_01615 [Anaerolineaceae bacterium]|nr:hypothetical protein [Anaerolineaceae bacterium]